ncbi:MAG TPA: hypothetical protein VF602_09865 [Pedobacter sp.]|jgi:hypothetical protein
MSNSGGLHDEELKLVAEEHKKSQPLYWLFKWKYKHQSWLNSDAPVFLDFGDDYLYWIRKREQVSKPLIYVQVIKKKDFLAKYTA